MYFIVFRFNDKISINNIIYYITPVLIEDSSNSFTNMMPEQRGERISLEHMNVYITRRRKKIQPIVFLILSRILTISDKLQ